MQTRSKVVELSDRKFQIRKLPPEVGSFIFMRMLGISMKSAAAASEAPTSTVVADEPAAAVEEVAPQATGEMRVRALSFAVFSGSGIGFEDFKFIQNSCMRAVSVVDVRSETEFPMPVMTDSGVWTKAGSDLSDDVGLVMRITTEVLVFCFSDFFEGSGIGM